MTKLAEVLLFAGVSERIVRPAHETFVTVRLNGGGAVPRSIGAGKTPVPFNGYRVRSGQLIYSRIDARNGAFALVPAELDGAVVSKDFPIFEVRADRVEPAYLLHFFRAGILQRSIRASSLGASNRQRITEERLLGFEIPLPPLLEQRRIAANLDHADALRAKRRHSLTLLEQLSHSAFERGFGDLVKNDIGWPVLPFGEVCDTRLGKMLDAKQQTGEHRRPYLRNANVQWFRFELGDLAHMDFDAAARSRLLLLPGDILICEGGQPGRCAVWQGEIDECYYQKALHRARPNPTLAIPEFIAHQLWELAGRGQLAGHVTSATIAHLTGEKLKALPLVIPPLELQREFASRVAAINTQRAAVQRSLDSLDELFASLQSRAFSGQL